MHAVDCSAMNKIYIGLKKEIELPKGSYLYIDTSYQTDAEGKNVRYRASLV
jgi:hypothetical protein